MDFNNEERPPARKLRAIRKLKALQPKVIEGPKNVLVLKGNKCSQAVSDFLRDMHRIRGINSKYYSKHHQIFPFEDSQPLQRLLKCTESSLFLLGSSSKKKPARFVFGRSFQHALLDMVEFQASNLVSMKDFQESIVPIFSKPLLFFQGEHWQTNPDLQYARNILHDFFAGNQPQRRINLKELRLIIALSAAEDGKVCLRTFGIQSNVKAIKSIDDINAHLTVLEMGPFVDLKFKRLKRADQEVWKQAHQKPAVLKPAKGNMMKDSMGNKRGKVFLNEQNLAALPLRKRKQLKKALKDQRNLEDAGILPAQQQQWQQQL